MNRDTREWVEWEYDRVGTEWGWGVKAGRRGVSKTAREAGKWVRQKWVRKGSEWVWWELGYEIYIFVVMLLWINASTITIQMHCNMTDAVSMRCWSPSGYHRDVTWRLRGLVQTHLTLNMTVCIHHVAFLCPAVKLMNKISHLRVAYVYSLGTILRPSVGIVLTSALCVAQGPSSYEIQNSLFVWPSSVNFGTVWCQH